MKENYGFLLTGGIIFGATAALILLFIGGISIVKIWQLAFAAPVAGSIPIWVIFLIGMIVIMMLKRR